MDQAWKALANSTSSNDQHGTRPFATKGEARQILSLWRSLPGEGAAAQACRSEGPGPDFRKV